MDDILAKSKEAIRDVSLLKDDNNNEKFQLLQDMIICERNFPKAQKHFCDLLKYQTSEIYTEIENTVKQGKYNITNIEFDSDKMKKNIEKIDKDSQNMENNIKELTDKIKEMKHATVEASELDLMMKALSQYQEMVNNDFLDKKKMQIEDEKKFYHDQKERALSFLFDIQSFYSDQF